VLADSEHEPPTAEQGAIDPAYPGTRAEWYHLDVRGTPPQCVRCSTGPSVDLTGGRWPLAAAAYGERRAVRSGSGTRNNRRSLKADDGPAGAPLNRAYPVPKTLVIISVSPYSSICATLPSTILMTSQYVLSYGTPDFAVRRSRLDHHVIALGHHVLNRQAARRNSCFAIGPMRRSRTSCLPW
jgi:hypothetical protein